MPNHKIVAIDNLSLQELDSEAELIPPKVHNPDLTKNKKILKRDLQGKHRR
jgi:ATP-dependent Lon protease